MIAELVLLLQKVVGVREEERLQILKAFTYKF